MKIKEFAQVINGSTPSSKNPQYYDGDIVWFTPKDLATQNKKYVSVSERTISEKGYKSCSTSMLPPGSVLMSSRAPIGLLAITTVPCCTNQGFKSFILDTEKCNPEYLYYYLKYHIKEIESLGSGTTFKEVSKPSIEEYEVDLPSLEKQKKTIEILSIIDSKIQNNNKQIQTLESLAKTIYDYWLVQFDFPNEDGKPYKSSGGKMVWNEELKREIPEGWKYTFIGSITNCYDSKRVPLSSKQRGAKKGEFPYYGATCVMDYVNEFIFDGDYVLMAEDGSIMKGDNTPILQRITGKTWVNNHAHILEPKKGYSCAVLMQLLKDIYVPSLKTGSIQAKITQEKMNSIKIIDIPSDLLYEINKQLLPLDSKVLHLQNEISVLNKLKGFILPLLMNGQVRISNTSIDTTTK